MINYLKKVRVLATIDTSDIDDIENIDQGKE